MVMKNPGFSLIELLTVLTIACILVAISAPSWSGYLMKQTALKWVASIKDARNTAAAAMRRDGAAYDVVIEYQANADNWCVAALISNKNCSCFSFDSAVWRPQARSTFSNSGFIASSVSRQHNIAVSDLIRQGVLKWRGA